jgi:acetylornithine deacetylase
VTLETVIEEECTGNGALAARARGYSADAAVIPEPFGRRLLEAQVGVMWARVTVRGKGAHAERASASVNAVLKACRLLEAVKELEERVNDPADRHPLFEGVEHPLNYNVGIVRGGDWASSVPEECVFEVRISCYPGEDLDEVGSRFRAHLLEAAKETTGSRRTPGGGLLRLRAEGCVVDRDEPIVPALQGATRRSRARSPASSPSPARPTPASSTSTTAYRRPATVPPERTCTPRTSGWTSRASGRSPRCSRFRSWTGAGWSVRGPATTPTG